MDKCRAYRSNCSRCKKNGRVENDAGRCSGFGRAQQGRLRARGEGSIRRRGINGRREVFRIWQKGQRRHDERTAVAHAAHVTAAMAAFLTAMLAASLHRHMFHGHLHVMVGRCRLRNLAGCRCGGKINPGKSALQRRENQRQRKCKLCQVVEKTHHGRICYRDSFSFQCLLCYWRHCG